MAPLCAPRAHHRVRWRDAAGVARRPLRARRVRRARDHRPLEDHRVGPRPSTSSSSRASSSTACSRAPVTATCSGSALAPTSEELRELAGGYPTLEETGAWIVARGGLAFLAHPYWTGVTPGTLELPTTSSGSRSTTPGCELEVGRGLSAVHWDELLESGRMCTALATDDSHHPGFDSGHAWTWVRARERTAQAVLEALAVGLLLRIGRAGASRTSGSRARPSSRQLLTVPLGDPRLGQVDRSGRERRPAGVPAGRAGSSRPSSSGLDRRSATLERCRPRRSHARIEVTDPSGMKAWSNPFRV